MGTEKPKDPNDETNNDVKVFDSQPKEVKTESSFATNDHDYNGGREVPVVTQQPTSDNFDVKTVRVKTELNCTIANNVYESNFTPNNQKIVANEGCSNCTTKCENSVSSTMRNLKRKASYDIPIKQEDVINHENDDIQNQPLPVDLDLIKVENGCSNSDCDSQSQCLQTYECNKCSLVFTDKEIFAIHYKQCNSEVPLVPSNNVARCSASQSHNSQNLKKLIESIREHPCLYNISNKDYINTQLKNVLWAEIATECNFLDVLSAKAAWNRLKDNFREFLKHPRNAKVRTFKYQKPLEFLLPYINSAIPNEHLNNEPVDGIVEPEDADDVHMVQLMSPAKKQKTVDTLNTSLRSSREAKTRKRSSSQPLDMFFMSMCETTKNLPSHLQILVKRRVFQAVIEAEEVAANHSANNQGTSNVQNEEYANVFSFCPNSTAVVDNSSSSQED